MIEWIPKRDGRDCYQSRAVQTASLCDREAELFGRGSPILACASYNVDADEPANRALDVQLDFWIR